jgi:hypothetical protein
MRTTDHWQMLIKWLQQNIAPLIASPSFQSNGLLIITFDESNFDDLAHGGGHIATVIISPRRRLDSNPQLSINTRARCG